MLYKESAPNKNTTQSLVSLATSQQKHDAESSGTLFLLPSKNTIHNNYTHIPIVVVFVWGIYLSAKTHTNTLVNRTVFVEGYTHKLAGVVFVEE